MPTQRKIFTVQNLTQKLKDAKALVLADYQGLTVEQMANLREQVKEVGGELEVVKNRLLERAFKDGKWEVGSGKLTGPTAALWIYKEDLSPLKALDNFIQKTDLPKIKFGFWGQELISAERIKELARLPTMKELKAKLGGVLQSPTLGLTNALNWQLKKLILLLKARGGEQK